MKLALIISASLLVFLNSVGVAQKLSQEERKVLFEAVTADERAAAECMKIVRDEQIKKFGKPLPRIGGHCWDGCPTRLPKPYYPEAARRNRVRGPVTVSAIVNESGSVVFAKMVNGNALFRQAALAAAYSSRYQPKVTCENKPIKFWWTIRYVFRPEM